MSPGVECDCKPGWCAIAAFHAPNGESTQPHSIPDMQADLQRWTELLKQQIQRRPDNHHVAEDAAYTGDSDEH